MAKSAATTGKGGVSVGKRPPARGEYYGVVKAGVGTLESRVRAARKEGWGEWIASPGDEAAMMAGCVFDLAAAERVRRFFHQFIRHSQGRDFAGKPFDLLNWQWTKMIGPLFGWKRPDGTRRFRRTYVQIPKKNGKSSVASGVGLYLLCGDGEPGAHVYSAAVDRPQAGIVHDEAINMVKVSPELGKALKINLSTKTITYEANNSFYRALAGDGGSNEGLKPHGIIIDELHAWHGRKNFDSLQWGFASRRNPLQFIITTAGDDMLSVCRQEYDYAKEVLAGEREDMEFMGLVYEAAPDADLNDEAIWHASNPSLGATITLDSFRSDHRKAKASPAAWAAWKRYRVNHWISATNPWLNTQKWTACGVKGAPKPHDLALEALAGLDCFGALDMGAVDDLSAFDLLFPNVPADVLEALLERPFEVPRHLLLSWFWLPEDKAVPQERAEDGSDEEPDNPNAAMYMAWKNAGYLELTEGNTVDAQEIRRRIGEIVERVGGTTAVKGLAVDRAYAMETGQRLQDDLHLNVMWFPQNLVSMTPGTMDFERMILAGELLHLDHPVLNWMAGNVALYQTSDEKLRRPVKPKNGKHRKIDGIVAGVMATGIWIGERAEGGGDGEVMTVIG